MNESLRRIIKELGLPNRTEILRFLSCNPANLSRIWDHVSRCGCNFSVSGLSKCLTTLTNLELVEKFSDGYAITGLGLLFLDVILRLDRIMKFKDELVDAVELMEIFPLELKLGLANLDRAEVEKDIYTAIRRAVNEIAKAEKWGKYVCRVSKCDACRILVRNYLRGVKDRMITSTDTLKDRIDSLLKAIKEENLTKEEIDIVLSNVEIRVLDLPFQLGVVDGRIAFFQILKADKATPAFISTDREFVEWAERVFDHFWRMAKIVRIPVETLELK